MKKRQTLSIYNNLSTLRNVFVNLKSNRQSKCDEINKLAYKINTIKTQL